MLCRVAFAAVAAVLGANSAVAADIPPSGPPAYQPPPVVMRTYDWTGIYLGVHGGYGFAQNRETFSFGGLSTTSTENLGGGVAGGQIGGNFQTGIFVFGGELDASWSGQTHTLIGTFFTVADKITWLTTARLRAGVAMDRVLFYATAGAGYGGVQRIVTLPGLTQTITDSGALWVVGAGIEGAVAPNVLVRAEYLYEQSLDRTDTFPGGAVTYRIGDHIARLALNFKFGGG